MGWLANFFFNRSGQSGQTEKLYRMLMIQSRNPALFGDKKIPDTYDGRLESLTNHMAVVFAALREADAEKSGKIRQDLFDIMVSDFNVALREEGLTDEGLKHRMRPMIGYFYARLKKVTENLQDNDELKAVLIERALKNCSPHFAQIKTDYIQFLFEQLSNTSLDDIVNCNFDFPKISN
ncbi:MAG: hypothetical protein HKN36_07230 [Hellea sp.]|nr:hypothetical protein [Hellea sp.]